MCLASAVCWLVANKVVLVREAAAFDLNSMHVIIASTYYMHGDKLQAAEPANCTHATTDSGGSGLLLFLETC